MNVEDRIRQLEQQNRKMKAALAMLVVGGAALAAITVPPAPREAVAANADQKPEYIEARGFRVLNENGKVCATLTSFDGEPSLQLWDKNDQCRAALLIAGNAPSLVLSDKERKKRVTLEVSEEKGYGPLLRLIDGTKKDRYLSPQITLGVFAEGPSLSVYTNKWGEAELEVNKGGPSLKFSNEKRDVFWSAP